MGDSFCLDVHFHILHGLDDGPSTLGESLKITEEAVFEGIDTIGDKITYNSPSEHLC
ncbi:hypothetical protein SAMN05421663_101323 [Terribacillus halophilus]|uniref:Uncharacterized protein n=1 Tax=Terribacillus halophilus TaxID=361279 RepID=A0A1G6ILP9_9BACI|nr:hypothetical protein SAMN05421663_101323 [Terribacillus halophilus]